MKKHNGGLNATHVPYDADLLAVTVDGVTIYNPLRTPDDSAFCTPERYGFELFHTGGGCMGYQLELPDGGYLLVTDEDGSGLPEETDEVSPVIGRYDAEGYPVVEVSDFAELPKNGSV